MWSSRAPPPKLHNLQWAHHLLSPLLSPPPPSTFLRRLNHRALHFSTTTTTTAATATTATTAFKLHAAAKPNLDSIASSADLRYESPLKIVEYPDPRLRVKNKRIVTFDDNLKRLVDDMFDVMYKTDGIGLSAPQVGINVQLMVFNPVGERGEGEEVVLINPKVTKYSQKATLYNEGCLSFPKIYGDVKRPESVKVDAVDVTGARFTMTLSELPARVFQHEFDHLLGVLFFERMTDEVLDTIRPDLEALEAKYENNTGLPSPEKIKNRKRRTAGVGFGKS